MLEPKTTVACTLPRSLTSFPWSVMVRPSSGPPMLRILLSFDLSVTQSTKYLACVSVKKMGGGQNNPIVTIRCKKRVPRLESTPGREGTLPTQHHRTGMCRSGRTTPKSTTTRKKKRQKDKETKRQESSPIQYTILRVHTSVVQHPLPLPLPHRHPGQGGG